jgi:hypothetical protein
MGIEAEAKLSEIHRWIERNNADGFVDSLSYVQNLERITDSWYDRLDRLEIDAGRFERERDEAMKQNAKLRDIAERAIDYLDQSYRNGFEDEANELRAELDQLKEGAKCPVCSPEQKCWECADDVSREGAK